MKMPRTPPAAGALGADVRGELEAHTGEKQSSLRGQRGQLHLSIPVNTGEQARGDIQGRQCRCPVETTVS